MPGLFRANRRTAGLRPPGGALGRRRLAGSLVVLLVAAWAPGIVWAQQPSETDASVAADAALAEQLRERFEWVALRKGWLLRPLTGDVERAVELSDGEVAIEGRAASAEELREWLGDEDAELVLQIQELDEAERNRLFAPVSAPPPEVVGEPETAEPDAAGDLREAERPRRARRSDAQVVVGSPLTVEEDETAEDVVVVGGPLEVRGRVLGDAVAIGGSVTVSGEVTGDVAAVGGSVFLEPGAEVLGEVISVGGQVQGEEEANIVGQVVEVPFGPNFRITGWPDWDVWGPGWWGRGRDFSAAGAAWDLVWWVFATVLVALLAFLVLLLARGPLERVDRRVATEPWKSALVGLAAEILFVPLLIMVVVILAISIIGIPLLILVPFAILAAVLIAFLGYCAVALRIGRLLEDRFGWRSENPYLVLLLGVVLIRIWTLIGDLLDLGWGPLGIIAAMFLAFGVLVKIAVWTVGLGAAILTRFGTAEGWGGEPQPALPMRSAPAGSGALYTESPPPPVEAPPSEPEEPQ